MLGKMMELTERALRRAEDLKRENEMYRRISKEVDKLLAELDSITAE